MNNMLVLYIPCKDKEEATHISMHLLEKKLIACSNIVAAISMYLWEGTIETSDEHILIAKTLDEKRCLVEKEVEEIHSYDCPAIVSFPVTVNKKYEEYITKTLRD